MSSALFLYGLLVLIVSTFFGTANLSYRDFSRHRVGELLEARGRARWLPQISQGLHSFILVTAVVRHAANILFIVLLSDYLRPLYARSPVLHMSVTLLAGGLIIVLIGVAVPNAWARHAGQIFIVSTFPVIRATTAVLRPVLAVMHGVDDIVRRLAGVPRQESESSADQLEQEILDVVSEGERHGAVDEEEKEMIESVIELRDMQVGEIMTPRTHIAALEASQGIEAVRTLLRQEGHSRFPVYEENIDHIIGVLYVKDLLNINDLERIDLRKTIRKVPFIPETKSLRDLLHQFQEGKVHIAVVLDEYGGTAGIITIEDIIEQLVGDIVDEYEPSEPSPVVRIDENTIEADAITRIDELNSEYDLGLPENDDYETIGGFIFSTLGRIPQTGESFEHSRLRISILQAEDRRVKRVRIATTPQQQTQEA